jgi:uncharacterized protein
MGESNAMIIRKAYQDFAQGNIPAVLAAFDASIAWHVPGHSPLSGDYRGHDQIRGFFRRTMELSAGAFSIDVHNVLAKRRLWFWPLSTHRETGFPHPFRNCTSGE